MNSFRAAFSTVSAICLIAATDFATQALAQGSATPRLVLARSAEVRLVDAQGRAEMIPVGLVLDVLRIDGQRIWTGRGWVHTADVVAVEDAVEFFSNEIGSQPTPFAHVSRARAHLQMRAGNEALQDCRLALGLDPNYAPAYCQRGRAQTALRQVNAALDSLNRAVELDDACALSYCCRAQTLQAMGDSATALADYDRAIALDSKLVVAVFGRAGIRTQQGDTAAALSDLTAVLELHPDHFLALNNRANIWAKQLEWERALTDYSAALKTVRRPDIFVNRSLALQAMGRLREAIADCNEAIRLDPKSAVAYRQRAALLAEEGRTNEAEFDLHQAERLAAAGKRI